MKFIFADKEYFEVVISKMKSMGYEMMAWVTISTPSSKYFAPVGAASVSRLFFHLPNKSLIVVLSYTQIRDYSAEHLDINYWSGMVVAEYNDFSLFRDQCWVTPLSSIPFGQSVRCTTPSLEDFIGGYFRVTEKTFGDIHFDPSDRTAVFDPEEDLMFLSGMADIFGKYCYPRFRRLDATGFAPLQVFPDQQVDFWMKFPTARLRQKVMHGRVELGCLID